MASWNAFMFAYGVKERASMVNCAGSPASRSTTEATDASAAACEPLKASSAAKEAGPEGPGVRNQ